MAKGKLTKDSQYHGQRETDKNRQETDKRQTISWPKGQKAAKDSQYHGQRETDKRQPISWPKGN